MITRGFPYGKGESFLENEINITAKSYDKILIFAQIDHLYSGFNPTVERFTPDNVHAFKIPTFSFSSFAKTLFLALTSKVLLVEILTQIASFRFSIYKLKVAINYFFRAKHVSDHIGQSLKTIKNRSFTFYSYWAFEEPLATISLKKKFGGVAFTRVHRADLYESEQKESYLPFRKHYLSSLNCYFSISSDGVTYLTEKYNSKKNIIHLSRLGTLPLSLPVYTPDNLLKVISIGALYPTKRLDLLIESLKLIKEFHVVWEHFGTGPDAKFIEDLATKSLTGKNISYRLHGFVENVKLRDYLSYNTFDVLVNTSSSEGIPVSIMEAMSVGVPCIATNVGGTGEIVNEKNGKLLSADPSAQKIADELIKFYHLPDYEQKQKREGAYNTWREEYSAEKNFNGFAKKIKAL